MIDTFATYPVLTLPPEGRPSIRLNAGYVVTGEIHQRQDVDSLTPPARSAGLTVLLHGQSQRAGLRALYDGCYGELSPLWVRSWKQDLRVATAATATATAIEVAYSGEDFGLDGLARWIYSQDHDTAYRITDAEYAGGDMTLTISPGLADGLAVGDFLEWFLFCRFAGTLTFDSITEEVCLARFDIVELQAETP